MEAKRSPKGKKVPKKNVFWSTKSQKGRKVLINSLFWSYKSQEGIKIEKVCLDCAGVYGSHVRPSRKLHFFKMLPLIFWCFSQGTFFSALLGRRERQSLEKWSKKGDTEAPCWFLFLKSGPIFQNLRRAFQDLCQKRRLVPKITQNPSKSVAF